MLPLLLLTMSIAVELPRPPLHMHMHITCNSCQHVTVMPNAFQPTALALFKPCLHYLLYSSITTWPPMLLSGKDRAVSSSVSPNWNQIVSKEVLTFQKGITSSPWDAEEGAAAVGHVRGHLAVAVAAGRGVRAAVGLLRRQVHRHAAADVRVLVALRDAAHDRGGAVAGAVHAGDGVEGDGLHVPGELRAAHDLARRLGVHADDAAVAQVEDVAPVLLHTQAMKLQIAV